MHYLEVGIGLFLTVALIVLLIVSIRRVGTQESRNPGVTAGKPRAADDHAPPAS